MMRSLFLKLASVATLIIASSAGAKTHAEPKTQAGVLAADDEWLAAERMGNVAMLNERLADGYRDVLPDGEVHTKAQLLGGTAKVKAPATGTVAEVAATFRKQHPTIEEVVIAGDTAILSFHSTNPDIEPLIRSVDVFTYEDGMWKGILSKHSSLPAAASSANRPIKQASAKAS